MTTSPAVSPPESLRSPLAKVLCIGLDAANPELLRGWAADGSLPTLRRLMDGGLTGDIAGIQGFFVGSTWPTLYAGVSPARHGFHYLVQLEPGTYGFHRPSDHGISWSPPFWKHLSEAGRRVAILDVPLTCLDPSLNGIQIVEWGGHDSVYGFQTSPGNLADTIRSTFGAHPLGPSCDGIRRTAEDYEMFLTRLVRGVRAKGALTRHLLRQGGWDLFMQVFTESHCVGHQCWHLHDQSHPAHDPSVAKVTGNPLLRVYQAIDTAIGEILQDAGDAVVMVFSAHSMAPAFGAHFLLEEILVRLGVATPVRGAGTPIEGGSAEGPGGSRPPGDLPGTDPSLPLALGRWSWRRLPQCVRDLLTPLRNRVRGDKPIPNGMPVLGVDVSSSCCFVVPNGLAVGGIRLNLKDREPEGVLESEAAHDFCEGLIADLLEIQDARTGRPLIRRVVRSVDLYQGEHLERLPDLLVEWDDSVPTGSTNVGGGGGATVTVRSEKIGSLEGKNDYGRSGEHRPRGMLIMAGPGLTRGHLEGDVSILDVAPTLCSLLGVEWTDGDGTVIRELASRSKGS